MTATSQPGNTGKPKKLPQEWQQPVSDWLAYLRTAGHPATTIATRKAHISQLARAMGGSPELVTVDDLIRYGGAQRWANETRRGNRQSARQFFTWAQLFGRTTHNPAIDLPKVRASQPAPHPTPDRVLAEAKMAARPREMLMLRLAAELGMRRGEVAQCHTRDLLEGFGGWRLLVHGKGAKQRLVPVSDELADLIRRGAKGHTPSESQIGYLCPGNDGGHLSPRWVGTLCAQILPDVWTMHSLRHRAGTRAYRGTRNLRAVQDFLGHASLAAAERYLAVDDDEVRDAMRAAA